MDYRKFGNDIVVRIDKGEEIIEGKVEREFNEEIGLNLFKF